MVAFVVLFAVLSVAAVGAAVAPRVTGHALAFGFGAAALVAGSLALGGTLPNVLGVTLLVIGAMLVVLAALSLRRSRAAWSALAAILAVLPLAALFGAPKVAKLLGTSLPIALIAPGLLMIAVMALAFVRDQYREHV